MDMQPDAVDGLQEVLTRGATELVRYGTVAVVAMIVFVVLWRLVRWRRQLPQPVADRKIDLAMLGEHGPPATGPFLEFYQGPVRLAAVVFAPAGRASELPPVNHLAEVFEAIVPGLWQVVGMQQPVIRRWAPQLSTKGFAMSFFQHVRLPGQAGRGTPWSSVAGMVKIDGQRIMVGLVLRAAGPTSRGQEILDTEEDWVRVFRVRG